MSISLTKSTKYGATVEVKFWKVSRREFNDVTGSVLVEVRGYASKGAFNQGAEPLEIKTYTKVHLPYDDVKGLSSNQMRDYIIANLPDFAGGVPD